MWPFKRKPYIPEGRVGWIKHHIVGAGLFNKGDSYVVTLQVEELSQVGNQSRIKVLDISGADPSALAQVLMLFDNTLYPTSDIIFEAHDPVKEAYQRGLAHGELIGRRKGAA